MVIKLNNSLITACNLNSNTPSHIDCFENIAEIRRRGFHFVISDRKLLEVLANHPMISDRAREVYRRLFINFTSETAVGNSLNFYVEVATKAQKRTKKKVRLHIKDFSGNSFLIQNKLLLENSNDAAVYELILEYYLEIVGMGGIGYGWDVRNGGGATTHSEYRTHVNKNDSLTFCILDSDKLSPYDSLGSTAQKFVSSPIRSVFGEYFVLPVHEMENLLPIDFINAVVHHRTEFANNKNILNKLVNIKQSDLLLYADLKTGVNRQKINALCSRSKEYWESSLNKVGHCVKQCKCKPNRCKHYYIHPFSRTVLNKFMEFKRSIHLRVEQSLNSLYEKIWKEIGESLCNVFCCPQPIIT